MQDLVRRSFSINLILMRFLGLYTPKKRSKLFTILIYCLQTILTIPVPIFGTLYFVYEENISMTQITNNAFVIVAMVCEICKSLPFVFESERIGRCINYFETSGIVSREKHKKILEDCSGICRRNTIVYLTCVINCIIFRTTKPFFNNTQTLPLDVWLPKNFMSQQSVTYSVYLFLVIAAAYVSLCSSVIDSLIGGFVILATGQLTILKDNLQHIKKYSMENFTTSMENNVSRESISDFIKKCIEHHNSILNFIFEFEECFTFAIFSQFLGSVLIICFCCLQIIKLEPLSYDFISNLILLATFMTQVYIYCYYGTMLFEESSSLTDACYMSHWYEFDMKSKKLLIILMERFKKPSMITAGKILNVSVDTFMVILKRSYSLLALLRSL